MSAGGRVTSWWSFVGLVTASGGRPPQLADHDEPASPVSMKSPSLGPDRDMPLDR